MPAYHDYQQAQGAGVLLQLPGLCARYRPQASLLCFLLPAGPTGTAKDSLAEGMIRLAEEAGALKPGALVTGAGAGDFPLALALACSRTGHPALLCLPPAAPPARRQLLAAAGAKLTLCTAAGREGYEGQAAALARQQGGWFADLYGSDLNPEYHRRVTGPALLKAAGNQLDLLVAGVGSGGLISGTGEFCCAWCERLRVAAVEPAESPVLSGGFAGPHGLEGIGCGFVPKNYNPYIIDRILPVSTGDGKAFAEKALLYDGLPLGAAAGAVLFAAMQLALAPENRGRQIVALLDGRVQLDRTAGG